jgi:Anaphase-promoting complex, subunit 10 (APC10)
VDFNQDESYTPKQISIRGGTTFRDLQVNSKKFNNFNAEPEAAHFDATIFV